MGYWIDCACGNRVEVTATQAGMKVPCACGKQLDVPKLSVLRRQEGSGAPPVSPELIVNRLYCHGGHPVGGGVCLRCVTPTGDRLACVVECEKPWVRSESAWPVVVILLLIGPIFALIYSLFRSRGDGEVLSEGKIYRFEASLCSVCQGNVQSVGDLKRALRRDADLARLLDKYPDAKVWRSGERVR
jgi:hypothetical protein